MRQTSTCLQLVGSDKAYRTQIGCYGPLVSWVCHGPVGARAHYRPVTGCYGPVSGTPDKRTADGCVTSLKTALPYSQFKDCLNRLRLAAGF
jgi:hypothetical protein